MLLIDELVASDIVGVVDQVGKTSLIAVDHEDLVEKTVDVENKNATF